jgi:transcription antitermination factor NusG
MARHPENRWYVIQTHPQAELYVAHELGRVGYDHYLPMIVVRRRDAVVKTMFHAVQVPMFAGYLFFAMHPEHGCWTPIRYKPGVKKVLMSVSMRPIPVEIGLVEGLIASAPARLHLASEVLPRHPVGADLRIMSGPMVGYSGKCLSCDGLVTKIEVEIFGRPVAMQMARNQLERV